MTRNRPVELPEIQAGPKMASKANDEPKSEPNGEPKSEPNDELKSEIKKANRDDDNGDNEKRQRKTTAKNDGEGKKRHDAR